MHTVSGGQNPDWHSDNITNYVAFWDYKGHQGRTIWLWEQIATKYKDNSINESCDPEHWRLPAFYDRLERYPEGRSKPHLMARWEHLRNAMEVFQQGVTKLCLCFA